MPEQIIIKNNGPEILETNYWQTSYAQAGKFYLSINSRAFRLLVPIGQEAAVNEMRTAVEIVISRGPWPAAGKAEAVEILFDDYSDAPYSLQLSPEQIDRLPPASDSGREDLTFSAWVRPCNKILEYTAKFRIVSQIPCLDKWKDKLL